MLSVLRSRIPRFSSALSYVNQLVKMPERGFADEAGQHHTENAPGSSGVFSDDASANKVYKKGEVFKPPFSNEPDDYKTSIAKWRKRRETEITDWGSRFQRISDRLDRSDLPAEANSCVSAGKYSFTYRGLDVCKCPVDFVLYHELFQLVKPKTIIELGTLAGGMAIWMADNLKLLDLDCQILSMDIDREYLSDRAVELKPDNVTFMQGDSFAIEKTFPVEFLAKLPHPWVFIEDAHANMPGVLRYFHQHCEEGDYMVVEDTNPDVGMGYDAATRQDYLGMGTKQLDALRDFLTEYEDYYAVDAFLTDMFGYNGSWHWHGFIRKMK